MKMTESVGRSLPECCGYLPFAIQSFQILPNPPVPKRHTQNSVYAAAHHTA